MEKWGDGGYKKWLVNGMSAANVCRDSVFAKVMANYNGTMKPECIFPPVSKKLKMLYRSIL